MRVKPSPDNPDLARVLEKQMRNWEIGRTQQPEAPVCDERNVAPFITIANIVGAGGNEVATRIGQRLGWPVFDRQILTAMAQGDHSRVRFYQTIDEREIGWFEDTVRSLMQREYERNDYFQRLTETIVCLAQLSSVFVGRAADLILPRDQGLRVKVVASRERCVENFARKNNTTIADARKQVDRIENERHTFVRRHFKINPTEPTRFDLLINVERFTTDQVVDMILAVAHQRRLVCSVK